MEVVVARGKAVEIKKLADKMTALKGVLHGTITGSASGSTFKPGQGHSHK
jgi:metal-responsive CopG/Arc/MetJ family transcriptional regulator